MLFWLRPRCFTQLTIWVPADIGRSFGKTTQTSRWSDRIAHAFKHVQTGHPDDPNLQPLSAAGVIGRPLMYYNVSGAYGLSRYNDPIGGVTLDGGRRLDVLSAIKGAAQFVRQQFEGGGNATKT